MLGAESKVGDNSTFTDPWLPTLYWDCRF